MPSLVDRITGKKVQDPDIPVCPDHDVEMHLRGKLGRPSRFHDQQSEEYTLIYFCPHHGCSNTADREVRRTQAAVPGAQPARPRFARRNG